MPIAKFEKVEFNQYRADMEKCFPGIEGWRVADAYNKLRLPERATTGSAGYDFFLPFEIALQKNGEATFPTGIRCKIDPGWFLLLAPRSGHGFKYGARLSNTVGIIDQDYYYAGNTGHIHCKIKTEDAFLIDSGSAYMQGIFLPFGVAEEAEVTNKRTGGFGSTDKNK